MKLQTKIELPPQSPSIDYNSKILLLGSCFSENIGDKLSYFQFKNLQNPFGILFHPIAIENLIDRAVNQKYFTVEDVFERDQHWFSFEVHSRVTATSRQEVVNLLNNKLENLLQYIKEATHVIITYGTSWVYTLVETNKPVANCHKMPQGLFEKELLTVAMIKDPMKKTVDLISSLNEDVSVLFTVSPVRHIKDGFVENTTSKAHLITAIQELIKNYKNAHYFPSFEIMMDELRDYRFYEKDLLHPNDTAIEIIWERFNLMWIDPSTKSTQKEIDSIRKGLSHKPLNMDSDSHLEFKKVLQQKINALQTHWPYMDFSE